MSTSGNFFIDAEADKWRRITLYLLEQKDVELIRIIDLARDTRVPPHEILDRLGLPPDGGNHSCRISGILERLTRREVGNRG